MRIDELFTDLGKLSPDQLQKGQRLTPGQENFSQVPGRVFYQAVSRIRTNDIARGDQARGLDTLTVYSPGEYNQMKCYLGKNNSSGYAIKDNSELVSVFSSQGSSGDAIVQDSIANGARHLDCFATRDKQGNILGALYTLYSRNGFKINTSLNSGTPGEPYSIVNGVSSFVDDQDNVHDNDPRVVIFMKI